MVHIWLNSIQLNLNIFTQLQIRFPSMLLLLIIIIRKQVAK